MTIDNVIFHIKKGGVKMEGVTFVIGIIVGLLLYYAFGQRKRPSGTFIIDVSDPMNDDVFKLDMYDSLNTIYSKKHIILNVRVIEDRSQN